MSDEEHTPAERTQADASADGKPTDAASPPAAAPSSAPAPSGPPTLSALQQRLFALRSKASEARSNTRKALEEEAKRKLGGGPSGAQQERERQEGRAERVRERAKQEQRDPEQALLLDVTAETAERASQKKRPRGGDGEDGDGQPPGWQVYDDDCQARVYERRVRAIEQRGAAQIRREYEEQRRRLGPDMFAGEADALAAACAEKPKAEAVDRMVSELNRTIARRKEFSRRRPVFETKDVDYINERNRQFNEKLARAFDPHTAEIRANLERGTSL
eukprot:m51a1_g14687 putative pre-mrna-splicing factor syf2-like (275) ;mRNA; r:97289-98181